MAVLLAAWLIDLRAVTHSIGLILLLVVAGPVLLTLGIMVSMLIVSLIAQDDAGAAEASEVGVSVGVWYYSRLATVRSPSWRRHRGRRHGYKGNGGRQDAHEGRKEEADRHDPEGSLSL